MRFVKAKINIHQIAAGLCILLATSLVTGTITSIAVNANSEPAENVKILFVMDTDYGVNYHYIRIVFERYGWEITTTALNQTIFECSYGGGTPLNVDILISEIKLLWK